MNIDAWLEKFSKSWKTHDIDGVLSLFSPKAHYWESPFKELTSEEAIKEEWQIINKQEEIELHMERIVSEGAYHTVRWELSYKTDSQSHDWAGLYLVRLNEVGKCDYFYQVGEAKK